MKYSREDGLVELFLSLSAKERQEEFQLVKQVATDLGKHPSTVRRWVDEGKVDSIKLFGTIYVYIPSLKEAVRGCQNQ